MSDDFTRQQRELIEKMIGESIARLVARPENATGDLRVPDVQRTRDLAN